MKKIIFLIIFCFVLPIFADGIIEIVPRPVNGVVGTDKIVIRGFHNSYGKKLKIIVEHSGVPTEYFPTVLNSVDYGFYQRDVVLSEGNNTIVLKKLIDGGWSEIDRVEDVKYETGTPNANKSLWGRIANDLREAPKNHHGEEQRAAFFYPGTRFPISDQEGNEATELEESSNLEELLYSGFMRNRNTRIIPFTNRQLKIIVSTDEDSYIRKDGIDTKGPVAGQKCWSSKDRINAMMKELDDANVNILIFVYWGDHHATLADDPDLLLTPETRTAYSRIPDNYFKIYPAPTFPETCDYKFVNSHSVCAKYTEEDLYLTGTNNDRPYTRDSRQIAPCQCGYLDTTTLPPTFKTCAPGEECLLGSCYKTCESTCNEVGKECFLGYCVDFNDIWAWHSYFEKENCEAIYSQDEYRESGMNTQGREFDAIDQMFKAAKDKGLLVVPTIESNQFHPFWIEFPHNLEPVKHTIRKMLEKYGSYSNWLKIYDKNGNPQKAIMISQALGIKTGTYTYPNGQQVTVDADSFADAIKELANEFNVAFLLDNTSMPDDYTMRDFYIPTFYDLREMDDKLLGVSIFGYPFDEMLGLFGQMVSYYDQTQDSENPYFEPLEDHMVRRAREWLNIWKFNTQEDNNIPLVANVIPGFDDRWRGRAGASFSIYGDNPVWQSKMADLAFLYNTAGINLAIWNGYGEGYVWVPYRKRVFENNGNYFINPDFLSGRLQLPLSYANLNFSFNGNEPVYEETLINDNYCFAQYLFGLDDDGDGVGNLCDNCPNVYNPPVDYELDSEFILGLTNDGSNHQGAILNRAGHIIKVPIFYTIPLSVNMNRSNIVLPHPINIPTKYIYRMQPDSDLDGIGDACDYETSGVILETGTLGFANSKIESAYNFLSPAGLRKFNVNRSLTINLSMPQNSGRGLEYCTDGFMPLWNNSWTYMSSSCNAAVHYCAINHSEEVAGNWGTIGSCSTATKVNNYPEQYNFGYSHGSDDFGQESIRSWQKRISVVESSEDLNLSSLIQEPDPLSQRGIRNGESDPDNDPKRKPVQVSTLFGGKATWNWRKDWFEYNKCSDIPDTSLCRSLVNAGDYNVENTMYYALSTSILPIDDNTELEDIPSYIITVEAGDSDALETDDNDNLETNDDDTDNNIAINDAYFPPTNTNKFARAARYNIEPMELNYYTVELPSQYIDPPFQMTDIPEMELCPSCYYDIPIKFIGINEIYPYDYVSRYMLAKDFENNVVLQSQRLVIPNNLIVSSELTPSEMMGVLGDRNEYFLALNTSNSGANWNKLGVIENWSEHIFSGNSIKTSSANFFIAERRDQTKHLYAIESASEAPQVLNNLNELPELVYNLLDLGAVSVSGDTVKLVYLNGKLYLLEQSAANFKMSSYNGSNFVEIQGTMPPQRNILNVATSGKYMFLAGGTDFSSNALSDLWRFDSETDTWTLVTNTLQGDFRKVIMQEVDGEIIAFNPVINGNRTFPAFEFVNAELIENITISNFTIPVPYDELLNGSYCLKETGTILQGGLEFSGECVPFTHPWYNSFSAGATVYSLDGKGDRLYAGTNNAIKVYDISDPISPVLVSSFSTNSRVNDIEVYGDSLFAATNGGLYKLDASNDTLTQTLFISTFLNSQYKVEVYNGKLYVGEDNGIKVRDLDTLSVLTSVNNDSVLDFAIENGEIGLYKDALFSPVEIRDADTLTLKANEFFGCFEIEVGSSGGKFYLSCDDETYRFEDDGDEGISFTELSGDIRELQDVYTFDGYTYFYDENTIWISTSSDVPAICGNGIVEGDEICDGGQIDCEELDSNYVSGTATCNSTCDGYNTNNCSDDGW